MIARINWNPNNKDLRIFGLTLIIGFGLIGGLFFWRESLTVAKWMWMGSIGIGGLAILAPPLSRPFYFLWMGLAFVMGTIVSFLILSLIFYGIITPVGMMMRLIGRDALLRKKEATKKQTYWHKHPDMIDKKIYDRLF